MQSSDIQISIHWYTCKPTPDDEEKTRREAVFRIKLMNFSKALFPCLAFSFPFQFSLGFSEQFRNLTLQYYVTSDQAFLSFSEKTDKQLIRLLKVYQVNSCMNYFDDLNWVELRLHLFAGNCRSINITHFALVHCLFLFKFQFSVFAQNGSVYQNLTPASAFSLPGPDSSRLAEMAYFSISFVSLLLFFALQGAV